jgi:hypothetical protein
MSTKIYFTLFLSSFISVSVLFSQFSGQYKGQVNGDQVHLDLIQKGNIIEGKMKDSKQTYTVKGNATDLQIKAKAFEEQLGLTFLIDGNLEGKNLTLNAQLEYNGSLQPAFQALLTKVSEPNSSKDLTAQPESVKGLPKEVVGKYIDPLLLGLWRSESHYSSGYGSSFSGSTYSYMEFFKNYTLADHGSQVNISDSNYSGTTGTPNGSKPIPNLWYYTQGNKIMVYLTNNGNPLVTELGTYYIENGKMLFTQVNTGKKILYTKI